MKMHDPLRRLGAVSPQTRCTLLLGLLLASGMFCGTLCALRLNDGMLAELSEYAARYGAFLGGELPATAVLCTIRVYFRCAFWVLFLGFCTAGVILIPALLAAEGFGLAFAAVAFSAGMGSRGALLGLAAFGLRCLFVFPCVLQLGALAWRLSLEKKHSLADMRPHMRTLCVCIFFLALGAALEITLAPRLLALVLAV